MACKRLSLGDVALLQLNISKIHDLSSVLVLFFNSPWNGGQILLNATLGTYRRNSSGYIVGATAVQNTYRYYANLTLDTSRNIYVSKIKVNLAIAGNSLAPALLLLFPQTSGVSIHEVAYSHVQILLQ